MKKIFACSLFILLAGCASPNGDTPPDGVGDLPEDYIISLQNGDGTLVANEKDEENVKEGETSEDNSETLKENQDDILSCREENAELSLEMDTLKKNVAECQNKLAEKPVAETESSGIPGVKMSHLQLIRDSILSTPQKEFSFNTCGQLGTFLRNSWYDSFSRQLAQAKIRFANGFLETEDFFGGCQSTEGKMAFFLGAERDETISFVLLKFDITNNIIEPVLMLDDSSSAVVTEFGKREGTFVKFPSDDGRVFRYYYDANIVVEAL